MSLDPNEQLSLAPAVCKGEFVPSPGQIYCSPRCKSAAHRRAPASLAAYTCPVREGIFTANPRLRSQATERSRSSSSLIASRSASCCGPSLDCSSLHRSRG